MVQSKQMKRQQPPNYGKHSKKDDGVAGLKEIMKEHGDLFKRMENGLKKVVDYHDTKLKSLDSKVTNMNNHSRQNNIVIQNMDNDIGNDTDELENFFVDLVNNNDLLNGTQITNDHISNIHRIFNSDFDPKPVIVRMVHVKHVTKILKNCKKLKNFNSDRVKAGKRSLVLEQDFDPSVRAKRRYLFAFRRNIIQNVKGQNGNTVILQMYKGEPRVKVFGNWYQADTLSNQLLDTAKMSAFGPKSKNQRTAPRDNEEQMDADTQCTSKAIMPPPPPPIRNNSGNQSPRFYSASDNAQDHWDG